MTSNIKRTKFPIIILLALSFIVLSLISCSRSKTTIGLIGDKQAIPMPSFYAKDKNASGRLPSYAQIRVYQITDNCKTPDCPIVWDVVVSEKHSPNEFVYGGFPGFGSQTIISAKPLEINKRYMIETIPDEFGSRYGGGKLFFRVTPEGWVIPD